MDALSPNSSENFETTYSQDERIEKEIRNEKLRLNVAKQRMELRRRQNFEEIFADKNHEIFYLPGLEFIKFTHKKIKFTIIPSQMQQFIHKKIMFYCSLQYMAKPGYWKIRRDTFPANEKFRIRSYFIRKTIDIGDGDLLQSILYIYRRFEKWANKEEERNIQRQTKFRNGEIDYIELTSEDEELFLTDEERKELFQRRQNILKRMLPPVQSRFVKTRTRPKKLLDYSELS